MAQPQDWSEPPYRERTFRPHFWVPTVLVITPLVAVFLFSVSVSSWGFQPDQRNDWLFATVVALAIGGPIAVWMYFGYSVRLSADAILGGNDLCIPQRVRFDEVKWARRPWYGFGAFSIVRPSEGILRLWIPNYLVNCAEFERDIQRLVGPDHPLRGLCR
jgi:hypothetical protein